jgi:hypothetical protein
VCVRVFFSHNPEQVDEILNSRRGRQLNEDELRELCTVAPGKHRDIRCDPMEEVREKERVLGVKLL